MWKTYAAHGLANIKLKKGGHVKVISSPLKGFPTKIFRHRFATHLIAAMNQQSIVRQNRVKRLIGHTQFSVHLKYMEIKKLEVLKKKEKH